jgi:dienelactone hydrolase
MSNKSSATPARQRNKRHFLIGISIFIIIFVLIGIFYVVPNLHNQTREITWSIDDAAILSFNTRNLAAPQSNVIEDTVDYSLEKVSYDSYDTRVYGLLRIPKHIEKPPVVIVLPAATVTKDEDSPMARALSSWGYASLTLDERGNGGETGGISPMDIMAGYQAYRNGEMPAQYAQIYDVLLGYDYLLSRNNLDGSNISVLGESMGGRFAIITAGIEPGVKSVFVISSGPYGLDAGNDRDAQRFVTSIEPATYLRELSPRKLVMFHFTNDPIIPIASGRSLFDKAGQPKTWYEYNGTVHGVYSDIYASDLHAELKNVFGR